MANYVMDGGDLPVRNRFFVLFLWFCGIGILPRISSFPLHISLRHGANFLQWDHYAEYRYVAAWT
jgi:hypothetical protein